MSNTDFNRLKELAKIGSEASKQLNKLIDGFDENLQLVLKNVKEEEKEEVEEVIGLFNKSFNLSKNGKSSEALELIKKFQNERQNNKKRV